MTQLVLVLEDEAVVAMDIAAEIKDAGWRVLGPAGTLERAGELLEVERPAAAILDVNLGGKRSIDLARQLRDDGVAILFLTGYAPGVIPDELSECPILPKPIDLDALVRQLAELAPRD
ncbi:Response regulator receiver domain-containing protein [Palleronia salina]|uniref:Response regulator receiver domain-containing protein n=1 Tax=Palleronia salina TaxID=313368 RepID=A0A1M6M1Q0_9RHOB|nr:response regulator [Palleronia salina]SHJ77230.1 Response regulator receiver domain-containing protein [Palleronia salina]